MRVWRTAVAAVLVVATGCVATGQAPIERKPAAEEPVATLKLSARLVTVAVNAFDAQGAAVTGLEREDFRLLEDGKEQKIAFFERQSGTPLSIVLAIDRSESVLTNERLEKDAAKKFVRTLLRDQDELDLIEFSDSVRELVAFTPDKRKIEAGLNALERGDATAVYDAIFLASERLGDTDAKSGRRRVLVLITDGGDTVHGVRYQQALEQAQKAGVMVYSLIVVPILADAGRNTGGEHALMQMAEDTGGKAFYVEDTRNLGAALAKVSDDLRTQYILGYYAPAPTLKNRSDGYRSLKVDLKGARGSADKVGLRYRTAYYAGK